jgi:hypothetical protein
VDVGDEIHFLGHTTDFTERIFSIADASTRPGFQGLLSPLFVRVLTRVHQLPRHEKTQAKMG